ncbi:MAG: hypothetical protein LBT80_03845 [Lactobacillaceae bacterium]|jgi:hypothetical protein|nr:hypothetical protein [Lactobacillaceae bacterium]
MNIKKIFFWLRWKLVNRYREFYSRTKIFSRLDKSDALGLLLFTNLFITAFVIVVLYLCYIFFVHFIGTNTTSDIATVLIILSLIPDLGLAKDAWQWSAFSSRNHEFLIYGTPLTKAQANFYSNLEGLSFQLTNYIFGYFIIYSFFLTIMGIPIYMSMMVTIILVLYKLSTTVFLSNVIGYFTTKVKRLSRMMYLLMRHILLSIVVYVVAFKLGHILGIKGNTIVFDIKKSNASNVWNQLVINAKQMIISLLDNLFGPNTFIGNLVVKAIKFNNFSLIELLVSVLSISIFLALVTIPIAKYTLSDLYNENILPASKQRRQKSLSSILIDIGIRIPTSDFGIPVFMGTWSMWAQFGALIGLNTGFYANDYIKWILILQLGLHIKEAMGSCVGAFPEIFSFDSSGRITELYILADNSLKSVVRIKLNIIRMYMLPSTIIKYIIIVISIHNYIYVGIITLLIVIMLIIYPGFLLYPSVAYPVVHQENIKLTQNIDQGGLWKLATMASKLMDSGIFILLVFAFAGYINPFLSITLSLIIFVASVLVINWGVNKLFNVVTDKRVFVGQLES